MAMTEENLSAASRVQPAAMPRKLKKGLQRALEIVVSFTLLVAMWETVVTVFEVPSYIVPAPSAISVALWLGLSSGIYPHHLGVTLSEILIGFAIGTTVGTILGTIMVTVSVVERIVYPYVVAIQTVPKVAIAPLFIIWFGFDIESKIIIVALICLFPVLINTISGLRAADSDRIALVRAMCGSKLQVLRYIQIPSALPYIFAGLNVAIVLAVIGAIVGEFVGARQGIGVLILQANFALDMASVFALLVVLSVTGVTLNLTLRFIERKVCFWNGKSTK